MSSLFQADNVNLLGVEDGYPHNSNDIVISPDGDNSRGYVQRITWVTDAWTFDGPTIPVANSIGPPSGGTWRTGALHADSGTTWDEMYCSAEVYLSPLNIQGTAPRTPSAVMQLPIALFGGTEDYGVDGVPDGTDGWQIRVTIASTKAGAAFDWYPQDYLFASGVAGSTRGITDLTTRPLVQMLPGKWWKVTLYVKLNTPGVADGLTRVWVGEVGRSQTIVSARNDVLFRGSGQTLLIRGGTSTNQYGGDSSFFAAGEDHYNYFDNYIWRTSVPSDIGEVEQLVDPLAPETKLYVDHEDYEANHVMTDADVIASFNATSCCQSVSDGTVVIVKDPTGDPKRGNVMRVFRAEGTGGGYNYIPSGGQWRANFDKGYDEMYFCYDMYKEPNKLWTKGQKIPGLVGGDWEAASGGSVPDGTDGLSARMMIFSDVAYPGLGDGNVGGYLYSAQDSQRVAWFQEPFAPNVVNLENGRWYRFEQRIKLNTPGSPDGIWQAWLDGVLVSSITTYTWRTVDTLKIDGIFMTFGYGGAGETWYAPDDRFDYFNNWIASTVPITH